MAFWNRDKDTANQFVEPELVPDINKDDDLTLSKERLLCALDGAKTALMMVDRHFKINYVNNQSMQLLKKHELLFKSYWPDFKAERDYLIGYCIDGFHANPAHQRQLLSNPSNLPYQTTIEVGEVLLELNVGAIINSEGVYVGNTLEWQDVTEQRAQAESIVRLQAAVDQAQTAMVMINRCFEITYVNQETLRLFKFHEAAFRKVWAGFTASKDWLMGRCIDEFHQHPAHQRELLSNPANLPYSTDITIGDLKIELNVAAVYDSKNQYIGNTLEWRDVTEERKRDNEISRLASAVEGMVTNLMMADKNGIILYLNPALQRLLSSREKDIRKALPEFDANHLVGKSIDIFHKNPAHQQAIISNPDRLPFSADIKVDTLEFHLTCFAMRDKEGEYIGPALQWQDITEQKDGQRQVESLIQRAIEGQLDDRIDTSVYSGFMRELGDGINNLLETLVSPLRECIYSMTQVAEGNLESQMSNDYNGEFGGLATAVNTSITNLKEMTDKITTSSARVASTSTEIAAGNDDLSQRVEAQASSLEQTAASMEQMTATVRLNADNAKGASELSEDAAKKASKGGEVVGATVDAMAEINVASKKISDIIGVIDEIAFQTNLLALNAAVEAARAGEQGRGFAVVAGEVRNLAQRSAAAAKEIKGLIKDSVEKVEEGSRLVDESGKTLNDIVEAVQSVTELIRQIAASSMEQSTGIDEINRAVTSMDEMTQQNASLVEETSAASQALKEEGQALLNLMQFFSNSANIESIESNPVIHKKAGTTPVLKERAPKKKVTSPQPANSSLHISEDSDEWEEF